MTKTENLILVLLSSQNNLILERLRTAKCPEAFISGASCHHHDIERSIGQIAGLLDKPHDPEDIEKIYQKEFIKKLFKEADEEDAARFLKDKYVEMGGDPDELY